MADNRTPEACVAQARSDQGPDAGERTPRQRVAQQLAQLQARLDAAPSHEQERQQDQGMEY